MITEKMDGSNVCLERNGCFARSHGHAPTHPSFSGFKALHARVRHQIPTGLQVFGEWLYAQHSIHYKDLPSYLQVFAVRDLWEDAARWRPWVAVEALALSLGVPTVPVLCRLEATTEAALRDAIRELTSGLGSDSEGLVVRWESEFTDADFSRAVGKWVRAGHVQTEEHWKSQPIVRNGLKKD